MINKWHMDAWDYIKGTPDKFFDVIICDPMYNTTLDMNELRRICSGHILMFCAEGQPFFKPDKIMYWEKPISTKNYSKNMGSFIEWITLEKHGTVFNNDLYWANYTGVFHDVLMRKPVHPYEKPVSLLERLIYIYSKPGNRVFDPFAGSGSTLKAAQNLGREAYGCEIEKQYFDLIP